MATNNERKNNLIKWADQALKEQTANGNAGISKILNGNDIVDAYNGSVAALGVSIAMGGLRPALAIYYQDKTENGANPKANRRSVLDVIARIITLDNECSLDFSNNNLYAKNLFQHVIDIENNDTTALHSIKQEVIDCSIALKQVIRTYNLKKND